MSRIPAKCVLYHDNRKVVVAEQKGKKFTLYNNSGYKIKKIKCDECLDQKENEGRCDYLVSIDECKTVFFIELKGSALKDALEQIGDTINYLKDDFTNFRKEARIIGNRSVPSFKNIPDYVSLRRKIHPGEIEYRTNKEMEESI